MKTRKIILGALLTLACAAAFAESVPGPDANHHGKYQGDVTRAEHAKRADEMFSKMDTNGDNVLTAAERKAARQKMRERRENRTAPEGKPQQP